MISDYERAVDTESYRAKSHTGRNMGSNEENIKSSWNDDEEEPKDLSALNDFSYETVSSS